MLGACLVLSFSLQLLHPEPFDLQPDVFPTIYDILTDGFGPHRLEAIFLT